MSEQAPRGRGRALVGMTLLLSLALPATGAATDSQWYGQPTVTITAPGGKVIFYGAFALLEGQPEQFVEALGDTATKVVVVKPGETVRF